MSVKDKDYHNLQKAYDKLEDKYKKLLVALKKYGRHSNSCASHKRIFNMNTIGDKKKCNCGLEKALEG